MYPCKSNSPRTLLLCTLSFLSQQPSSPMPLLLQQQTAIKQHSRGTRPRALMQQWATLPLAAVVPFHVSSGQGCPVLHTIVALPNKPNKPNKSPARRSSTTLSTYVSKLATARGYSARKNDPECKNRYKKKRLP